MKKLTFSIAAAALAIAGSTATFAAELPSYETNGFPESETHRLMRHACEQHA